MSLWTRFSAENLTTLDQLGTADAEMNSRALSSVKQGRRPPLILTYHEIEPQQSTYLYGVSCTQFEDHLRLVSQSRWGAEWEDVHLRVTFDDGHISNYLYALPLLDEHSVQATFFISAGFIGSHQDHMSWAHLREAVAMGHRVQSHGLSHKLLSQCSTQELELELLHSKQAIEDRLGKPVDSISAPGGLWNRRAVDACLRYGYKYLYGSRPWNDTRKKPELTIWGRLMVCRSTNATQIESLFNATFTSRLPLRARAMAQETLRSVLGDNLYIRLWRILAKQKAR